MRVFLLLLFFKFIVNIEATKPKSVNLALETVLQFDQKNIAADVKFLDNVQEFLDKVRSVIRINNTRRFGSENKNIKFTDFIKSVIDILKSYDDDDLEAVFAVFDDEIRKYHYRGCKFYELVEDQNVRRFVANKLEEIKDKPADKLRQNLNNAIGVIDDSKFSGVRTEFLDYVNSLYRPDSTEKLREFLNKLQAYSSKSKRANLNLIKVVRDGIRSIIFDHYSKLNANARRDLKIKLETSWRNFKHPERFEHSIWTVQYTNRFFDLFNRNLNDNTKDIKRELTTPVPASAPTIKSDSESKTNEEDEVPTNSHESSDEENKKTKEEVYFYKDKYYRTNDNDFERVSTTMVTKYKYVSSESDSDSSSESTTAKSYKHKTKQRKPKTIEATQKYVKPKKQKHNPKKLSTFVTLYPDRITVDHPKRFKIKATTRKPKLFTLWEEEIKHKPQNEKRNRKLKRSKSKINLRTEVDKPRVIADSDTIINVNRAVSSEDISLERKWEVSIKKHQHQTRTTQNNYKATTRKKNRKHIPKNTLEDVQSGISIESFEIQRRSLDPHKETYQNETQVKLLRRINQLEKQLEQVKIKIDTKPTTAETKFSPRNLRIGTTAIEKADTTTQSTTITIVTKPNITTEHTTFETTTATLETESIRSVESTTEKENITEALATESVPSTYNIQNTTDYDQTENYDAADEANDIGVNVDNDLENIMKKYNVSVTPATKPFNIDMFLEESKPVFEKESVVKGIMENDFKKIFQAETTTENGTTTSIDPLHDLNVMLNLT